MYPQPHLLHILPPSLDMCARSGVFEPAQTFASRHRRTFLSKIADGKVLKRECLDWFSLRTPQPYSPRPRNGSLPTLCSGTACRPVVVTHVRAGLLAPYSF